MSFDDANANANGRVVRFEVCQAARESEGGKRTRTMDASRPIIQAQGLSATRSPISPQ